MIMVKNREYKPTPPLFGAPLGARRNSTEIFYIRKLKESLGYRMALFM